MDHDNSERPTGVTVAAALIAITGIAGVVVRMLGADFGVWSAGWLLVHLTSLGIAYGLWNLKPWAYWLFIIFVLAGVVVTVARLVFVGSSFGPIYHLVRLGIMVAWLVYFSRWQVRGAFAPPGSGYGR